MCAPVLYMCEQEAGYDLINDMPLTPAAVSQKADQLFKKPLSLCSMYHCSLHHVTVKVLR